MQRLCRRVYKNNHSTSDSKKDIKSKVKHMPCTPIALSSQLSNNCTEFTLLPLEYATLSWFQKEKNTPLRQVTPGQPQTFLSGNQVPGGLVLLDSLTSGASTRVSACSAASPGSPGSEYQLKMEIWWEEMARTSPMIKTKFAIGHTHGEEFLMPNMNAQVVHISLNYQCCKELPS